MFYRHWKKLALALTGLFWASCDFGSSTSEEECLYGCPPEGCDRRPDSSDANIPNSSDAKTPTSSSSEATKLSSSSGIEMQMPLYGVIMDKPVCTQVKGESTLTCEDGTVCTQVSEEHWGSLPCSDDICPAYGVVQISENTYECDGVKYNEAEFHARYNQIVIPKDSSDFMQIVPDYGVPHNPGDRDTVLTHETLCFNDSAQNVDERVFKIIDCIDGNKYLRDPSAAGVEGVELPEGVQVFAPKAGSEQAPNCTETGDICIERNPNLTIEEDSLAGCHPIIDCPEKTDATYIKVD